MRRPKHQADFSADPDMLNVLAGMPQNETTFEYLAGCWKRLNVAIRDTNRHVGLSMFRADDSLWTPQTKMRGQQQQTSAEDSSSPISE